MFVGSTYEYLCVFPVENINQLDYVKDDDDEEAGLTVSNQPTFVSEKFPFHHVFKPTIYDEITKEKGLFHH